MRPQPMHLDDLPPLSVPMRFHLTAPWFGVAAGAVMWHDGATAWATRWGDAMLAATHLLTIGFLTMVMVGSLFQVVPVLGGRALAGQRGLAWIVHVALVGGVAALVASLWRPATGWWGIAIALLLVALVPFAVALGQRVARARGAPMFVIRFAAMAFVVTVGVGTFLAVCRGWPDLAVEGFRMWTDVHAAWGIAGWVGLLIAAVGLQVVPMFLVAPAFRAGLVRVSAVLVFVGLVVGSHARSLWLVVACATLVSGGLVAIAVHALARIAQRRRARRTPLVGFWQLGLVSLVVASVLGWGAAGGLAEATLAGAVALVGFALTVVIGMQLELTAFLAFLHLQRRCLTSLDAARELPTMRELVSERAAWTQLGVHTATVCAVVAAVAWWPIGPLAAGMLIADFGLLGVLLVAAIGRYRRAAARIAAAATG